MHLISDMVTIGHSGHSKAWSMLGKWIKMVCRCAPCAKMSSGIVWSLLVIILNIFQIRPIVTSSWQTVFKCLRVHFWVILDIIKSEFLIGGSILGDTIFCNTQLFMYFRVGLYVRITWPKGKKISFHPNFLAGNWLEHVLKKCHFLTNWAILARFSVLEKIKW
jgi:hypothetical protein